MTQHTQPPSKKRSGKRGVFVFLGITLISLSVLIIGGKAGSEVLVGTGLVGLLASIVTAIVVFNPSF